MLRVAAWWPQHQSAASCVPEVQTTYSPGSQMAGFVQPFASSNSVILTWSRVHLQWGAARPMITKMSALKRNVVGIHRVFVVHRVLTPRLASDACGSSPILAGVSSENAH